MLDKIREEVRRVFEEHGIANAREVEDTTEEVEEVPVVELILLTSPTCPACQNLKKKLAYALEQGWIREVSVTSDEGREIADSLNLMTVPELVAVLEDGSYVLCEYRFEGDDFVFELTDKVAKKK